MRSGAYEGIKNSQGLHGQPEQIIYRYNGDPKSDETIPPVQASESNLNPGRWIKRHGRDWMVVATNKDFTFRGDNPISVLRVYLGDCA